ncbi:Transcriptional activator spt7 [Rhizina undulata]
MSSLPPTQWQRIQSIRDDSSQRAERTRTNSVDTGIDMGDKEEAVDPVAAAFRERYLMCEKSITSLFRTDYPCCAPPENYFPFLDLNETPSLALVNGTDNSANHITTPPPARQLDDDDYDFDDDDEDEDEKPKSAPPPPAPIKPSLSHSQSVDSSKTVAEAKTPVATREKLEADRKAAEQAAKSAFSSMFFTLENDRDAMLEQQKLEESDRQVNAETSAAQVNAPGKLSSANLGASSLTLKHLIARIDATREKVQCSDMELRNLMSEVRKNRSKWANEDKVGQEELYEAAEKVVLDLRSHTEHSTAFLNRVNKREAPDYYLVIKHPMDLGTVMKKLKSHQYKSKKEFVDDLNLIWANCLTYNADPSHYLRKHAKAMQKHTQTLIPLIPDIVIRDRAEVELEEVGALEVDAEGESDDEPIMSSRGRKGPGTKKTRKGASQARLESTPEVKAPTVNLLRADSNPPGNDVGQGGNGINGFLTPLGGTPLPNGVSNLSSMDIDHDKPDDDTNDVEYQAWKKMTKKARAKVASDRHKLIVGTRLNPDEPALLRSREGMGHYIRNEESHFKSLDETGETSKQDSRQRSGKEKLADATEDPEDEGPLLPDYYDPLSCVPEIPWRVAWRGDEEEIDISDDYSRLAPKGIFVAPQSALTRKLDANIKQMQDTRKLCSKISVIKQMQVQTQMYSNQFTKYDPKEFVEADAEDFVISEDGPIMCGEMSRAALQRSVGKIFYHAGFEEFQPTAMDAVTDIAVDYFQKLAKTLLVYSEAPDQAQRFSQEEMLLHALYENGADLDSLEIYIREDIERLGTKLNGIHERMKAHLTDLLRPAFADANGDGSNLFNDGSEQFVGGDFAEDIGDDFFGFKELGLDKEFGLSSLSVPLHLLQGRMRSTFRENTNINTALAEGFKPPPPFEPLTHEILKQQIGLVQNFFLAKLHASNDEPLVEDEDLPQKQRLPKPRLPPTGKISMPRKRPLQSQGGNSKKKKKPNPPLPAATKPANKDAPVLERTMSKLSEGDAEGNGGMMSPESLVAGGS